MKNVLLFLIFLCLGFVLVICLLFWNKQEMRKTIQHAPITTQFSLANAPSESLRGTIATFSGTVNWESRVATTPAQLKSPETVQQGEQFSTGKVGSLAFLIQNEAKVTLASNSLVSVIQLLPNNLVFSQNQGVVFYQNAGKIPLSVVSLNLETLITYGWATIAVNQVTNMVTVTVQRGYVKEAYEDSQNNSNVVTVNAGQQFIFDDTGLTGSIQ